MSTLSPNSDATSSGTSPKTIAVIVVILAFSAGVITGLIGDRLLLMAQHRLMPAHRGIAVSRIVDRLDQDLHFTASQRTAVTQILTTREQHVNAIMGRVRPQIHAESDVASRQIEALLTSEQRTKFIQIRARSHRPSRWFSGSH